MEPNTYKKWTRNTLTGNKSFRDEMFTASRKVRNLHNPFEFYSQRLAQLATDSTFSVEDKKKKADEIFKELDALLTHIKNFDPTL